MIDIHSHLVPGVDDGSNSLETSQRMLQAAAEVGVTQIVATPHVRQRINRQRVCDAFAQVYPCARSLGIDLYLGFEVHYDVLLKLNAQELEGFCFQDSRTLLLEFHREPLPPQWEYIISDLSQAGYQVIIAHPERYLFIQRDPELIRELRRYGCQIQLDAGSFLGRPWDQERITAYKLLKANLTDFIGSDAHRPKHYVQYGEVIKKLGSLWPQ